MREVLETCRATSQNMGGPAKRTDVGLFQLDGQFTEYPDPPLNSSFWSDPLLSYINPMNILCTGPMLETEDPAVSLTTTLIKTHGRAQ